MEEDIIFGFDMTEIPAEYADAGVEFALLPAGRYPFTITAINMGANKSGVPMVTMIIRVDGSEYGMTSIRDYFTLNSKSLWKASEFFRALNAPVNPVTGGIIMTWDASSLVGQTGVVELTVEDYINKSGEQKQSNKVAHYRALGTPCGAFQQAAIQPQTTSATAGTVTQPQATQPTQPQLQTYTQPIPIPGANMYQPMPQHTTAQPVGYNLQNPQPIQQPVYGQQASVSQPLQTPGSQPQPMPADQIYQAINQANQGAAPVQNFVNPQAMPGRMF